MPTIDALAPAIAATDADAIPVSQAGVVRKLTRAQLLEGTQPELALPPGTLLGRAGSGIGGPEGIRLGQGLSLSDGTLSGPAPYSAAGLPPGRVPGGADLVPLAQGGRDATVGYGAFMSGLGALSGISLSRHVATAEGAPVGRSLSAWLADGVPVEAFGAVGDGVADDTAALAAAVASGLPVRLGPRTYGVRGQWTVSSEATLLGVPGRSVLRRIGQASGTGAFVCVQGPRFYAHGVVFDTAGEAAGTDAWCVLVTPGCAAARFEACTFQGAVGGVMGCGLVLQGTADPGVSPAPHLVQGCEARGNAAHGIYVQAGVAARVLGCSAHGNGGYGICVDDNDPARRRVARFCAVEGNHAWGNERGISIGNFNEANAEPPRWGNALPDAACVLVSGNVCHANRAWGIAVSGREMLVCGNMVADNGLDGRGGGILANARESRVAGNAVSGAGHYGIDAGGSVDLDVCGNRVSGAVVGINPGGSRGVRVDGNTLSGNLWGITAYNVETDGRGRNFGLACTGLSLTNNQISFGGAGGGGILLLDAPQDVLVAGNRFFGAEGAQVSQCLWAHTDSVAVRGNSWNGQMRPLCNPASRDGAPVLVVPDVADEAMVASAPEGVAAILTEHQAEVAGQIGFVRVTAGGSGYTWARVTIAGSGTGARAMAHLRDGAVIGVALLGPGTGYGGAPVLVGIEGDGQGASAVASVGLPAPEGRNLRVHCNAPVRFRHGAGLDNWTGAAFTVPAGASADWSATWGAWRAVGFASDDHVVPAGDGGLVLRAPSGDLALRAAGRLHVGSDAEPWGFVSALGRGSPEGAVAAPPGSDYRNLDGGEGATLWLKRAGTGASGWVAVA